MFSLPQLTGYAGSTGRVPVRVVQLATRKARDVPSLRSVKKSSSDGTWDRLTCCCCYDNSYRTTPLSTGTHTMTGAVMLLWDCCTYVQCTAVGTNPMPDWRIQTLLCGQERSVRRARVRFDSFRSLLEWDKSTEVFFIANSSIKFEIEDTIIDW
jgi:hypothetical protein